jgi:hypothetical protein
MRRREFIGLVGGTAAWPLAARAQQQMPVIGWLGYTTLEKIPDIVLEVKRGLAENDFIEGRNFKFEYRFAEFHPERVAALTTDLVQHQVDLIIMFVVPPSDALIWRSPLPPIVFFSGSDPVKSGLVDSLRSLSTRSRSRRFKSRATVAAMTAPISKIPQVMISRTGRESRAIFGIGEPSTTHVASPRADCLG